MIVEILTKIRGLSLVGFLKGKISFMIFEKFLNLNMEIDIFTVWDFMLIMSEKIRR